MINFLCWVSDCHYIHSIWKFIGNVFMSSAKGITTIHWWFFETISAQDCLFFTVQRTVFSLYIKMHEICHNCILLRFKLHFKHYYCLKHSTDKVIFTLKAHCLTHLNEWSKTHKKKLNLWDIFNLHGMAQIFLLIQIKDEIKDLISLYKSLGLPSILPWFGHLPSEK